MKWKWFFFASFLVLCALVKQGVPLFPVVAGIAAVGLVNFVRNRRPVAS